MYGPEYKKKRKQIENKVVRWRRNPEKFCQLAHKVYGVETIEEATQTTAPATITTTAPEAPANTIETTARKTPVQATAPKTPVQATAPATTTQMPAPKTPVQAPAPATSIMSSLLSPTMSAKKKKALLEGGYCKCDLCDFA